MLACQFSTAEQIHHFSVFLPTRQSPGPCSHISSEIGPSTQIKPGCGATLGVEGSRRESFQWDLSGRVGKVCVCVCEGADVNSSRSYETSDLKPSLAFADADHSEQWCIQECRK